MKILVAHNFYQQAGGEDNVYRAHVKLLREKQHDVVTYERHNHDLNGSLLHQLNCLMQLNFNQQSYRALVQLIKEFKPDIVHVHNMFFMISPAIIKASRDCGVPLVMSAHNFRLMCINGLFYRDNQPCEDCLSVNPSCAVKYRCYRNSLIGSFFLNRTIQQFWHHQKWVNDLSGLIVATEFSKQKHLQAGFPSNKIHVLPHCVQVSSATSSDNMRGQYALYAGRLSEEKGIKFLLKAWEKITTLPLLIIGQGPLEGYVKDIIKDPKFNHIKLLGYQPKDQYVELLRHAYLMVVPSVCYESFPLVVAEAYAQGVPVVANAIGTLPEVVIDGQTGKLYTHQHGLKDAVHALLNQSYRDKLSDNAKKYYEDNFTTDSYHKRLTMIYQKVLPE